jgi:ATP-binding cassette subfamily B protein
MRESDTLRQKVKHTLRLDRAVRFVWDAGPGWTITSLALVFLQGILPLLALYVMKLIVDGVTFAMTAPDKNAAFRHVVLFIGFGIVIALFNALFQMIAGIVKEAQALEVTDYIYDILHAKSIEVDLEYYENPQFYDTLHRAQNEGPFRPTSIVNNLVQLGQSGISLVAMAGLLFSFYWGVAVVLFAASVPGIVVRLRYSGKLFRWHRDRTPMERRTDYFNWMLTGGTHAKEIRLFGLGEIFISRFSELRSKLRQEQFEISRKRSVADFGAQAGATLAVFSCFGFIAYRTVQGGITLGDMVMYFGAFQRGMGYLRQLLGNLAGLYEDNLFISNFYEFLDLEPKVKEPLHPSPVPRPIKQGIVLDHVSFKYPGGNREVLKDISLSIGPDEVVALVGENGSGKTTLVKLLCRLYDPLSGTITLDGIDLRQFNTTTLRREISIIFQDYVQYHMTAGENIWFGNIELSLDSAKVKAAAKHAGADNLITSLPKEYETILGRWFEDGEELSMGQWQKIALARAFLRESQLMILDEPASSLDVKTEYEVFKRFRKMRQGRAAVLISHRFSTVRMADRIFVFHEGKIIESGSHEDLVRYGGKYANLFEKQSQFYK